jgi:Sec-independent protein translocase protein TatA
MKGLGKGVKSFKEGIKDVQSELEDIDNTENNK